MIRFRLRRAMMPLQARAYDLPLHNDPANRFLVLLMALMTTLAMLSAAAGLTLSTMAERWTSGIEGRLTVEIPALGADGGRLEPTAMKKRTDRILALLNARPGVADVHVQEQDDVGKMVAPWLGNDETILDQVPLPVLIGVTLKKDDPVLVAKLQKDIPAAVHDARVETHQSWLNDLLRLTSTLSFAAWLIGLITAITAMTAVVGAVRARMTAHHEQIEILHLIGAADDYIARQFQRHALHLSMFGAGVGALIAICTVFVVAQLSGTSGTSLLPQISMSLPGFLVVAAVPVLGCLITVFTTRLTVLQSLREMP